MVSVETLALVIRQNPEIIGIKIVGVQTKLLQYADDTTAVLSDINSAQALLNLLEVFKNLSGLVINSSKTERKWIRSSRDKTSKPFGMKRLMNQSKPLVFIAHTISNFYTKNILLRDWTASKHL